MSIKALPASTVRRIGSSQAVADPPSALKEMIDNALDARAMSIFVEISANGLDVLQVRDNGHGVAHEDREMICRRYCTSKIKSYADLQAIGGKWLGFRGEALNDLAELSGGLTFTTRVEGEQVATMLVVGQDGEIRSHENASHPVGTTVRAVDLFKALPVRQQTASKNSSQTLVKVKHMLQGYALARPSIRFSLRIIKAKTDKGNWMYAPKPNINVHEAAMRITGKASSEQYAFYESEHHGFKIHALLPKHNADISKVDHAGVFFSVDSRPVSSTRGTLRNMLKLIKERIQSMLPDLRTIRDPFLCLNIFCPPGSYDANVEPSKDDVIFEDAALVIKAMEAFLDLHCPHTVTIREDSFDPAARGSAQVSENESDDFERPVKRQRHLTTWKTNMFGLDNNEESVMLENQQSAPTIDLDSDCEASESELQDINVFNPWTVAKMTSSMRVHQRKAFDSRLPLNTLPSYNEQENNASSASSRRLKFPSHPPWQLPTPEASSSPAKALPAARRPSIAASTNQGSRSSTMTSPDRGDFFQEAFSTPHVDSEQSSQAQIFDQDHVHVVARRDNVASPTAYSLSDLSPRPQSLPPTNRRSTRQPNRRGLHKPFVPPTLNTSASRNGNTTASQAAHQPRTNRDTRAMFTKTQTPVRHSAGTNAATQSPRVRTLQPNESLSPNPPPAEQRPLPNRGLALDVTPQPQRVQNLTTCVRTTPCALRDLTTQLHAFGRVTQQERECYPPAYGADLEECDSLALRALPDEEMHDWRRQLLAYARGEGCEEDDELARVIGLDLPTRLRAHGAI